MWDNVNPAFTNEIFQLSRTKKGSSNQELCDLNLVILLQKSLLRYLGIYFHFVKTLMTSKIIHYPLPMEFTFCLVNLVGGVPDI